MSKAYLLIGSNLGDRLSNLNKAIDLISQQAGSIITKSSVYETEPWGSEDNKAYLNQVIGLVTPLEPSSLLKQLLNIEGNLGRYRTGVKNEPRTIDIDILFIDDQVIDSIDLEVPHKRLHQRKFVLIPLTELEPLFMHPVLKKTISQLLEECEDTNWVRKFDHE